MIFLRNIKKCFSLVTIILLCTTCKTLKKPAQANQIVESSQIIYHPLESDKDLDILIKEIGDARIVLLGESTHGTREFYEWRSLITKRLVTEKGFNVIAVEGEWADSYRVNRFIKGPAADSAQAVALLRQYDRWPTWMWGNYETAALVTWLNQYNQGKANAEKAGFYGLDVYCLWESMEELMPFIQNNTSLLTSAQQVHQCFQPFSADPMQYAYAVSTASANCRSQAESLWESAANLGVAVTPEQETAFLIQQNALVALNGETVLPLMIMKNPGTSATVT